MACEYAVLKNTMIDLAVKEQGWEGDMKPHLNGPTAVAFSYDDAGGARQGCEDLHG